MYLPYLMLGYAAAILLMIAGCRVSARTVPGLAGVRLLSWGLTSGLLGVLLLAARPVAPAWVTIVLANDAIFAFSVLFYGSVAQCLCARIRLIRWVVMVLLAGALGNGYYIYVVPNLTARILISSLLPALCAAAAARLLFRYRTIPDPNTARPSAYWPPAVALAWLQVLVAIHNVARCILTFLYPPSQILRADVIQAGYTYLNLILNLGSATGLIWLAHSIQREDLYTRADTDGLTKLLNRRAFEEILARELRRPRAFSESVIILLADIDHFKAVNDAWGHPAGDDVIRQVGAALRRVLRPTDILSRFGGEEFAILLRETTPGQAKDIAERVRSEVAGLPALPGGLRVTISLGLAARLPIETPEDLLRRCDEALYRSKRGGRNRVVVADARPEPSEHLWQNADQEGQA